MAIDPKSQVGKFPAPAESFDVLVIGAGEAGVAAALEAASAGASVMLVDENPIGLGLAGLDVPFTFGGRAGAALAEPDRMVEQILTANPALEAVFEAGVDVALGTAAFGLFLNGPGARHLPCPIVGLTDDRKTWHVGFRRAIVATGARDLTLFFEGSDLPGVIGSEAFHSLLTRHDAFDGRRIVVLGSGAEAVGVALAARARGLDVAGLVEVRDGPVAAPHLLDRIAEAGIPIFAGQVVQRATGNPLGLDGAVIAPVGGGDALTLACDTIVMAIGRVPAVDLLDAAGVSLAYDDGRGGWTPATSDGVSTSLPEIFVAGDCAALGTTQADAHGRAAARAALASLEMAPTPNEVFPLPVAPTEAYRLDWMKALLASGGEAVHACRCEEVTRAELFAVKPPRYLAAEDAPTPPVECLDPSAPPNPDQIKRLTRAGMGPCQGRRCREQIALMLALRTGQPVGRIPLAGYRAPVRPIPLSALADWEESAEATADWDVWFGIPTQWVPYEIIGTPLEAEYLGRNMHL